MCTEHSHKYFNSYFVCFCPGVAWLVIPRTSLNAHWGWLDFQSWRLFVVLCSVPSLSSALIFRLFMPESPKFLMEVRTDSNFDWFESSTNRLWILKLHVSELRLQDECLSGLVAHYFTRCFPSTGRAWDGGFICVPEDVQTQQQTCHKTISCGYHITDVCFNF